MARQRSAVSASWTST